MTTRKGREGDPNDEDIRPEWVVEESKDPDAPTHGMFEWNDAEAAHQWFRVAG